MAWFSKQELATGTDRVRLVSRNSASRTWCWFTGVFTYSFNKQASKVMIAAGLRLGPETSEEKEPWS